MVSKIYFDPPLWLQRQAWTLSKLRQENVDSVADVGCAEGTLISALTQPAFQIDPFPIDRFPLLKQSGTLLPQRHWIYTPADLVLSSITGLDLDPTIIRTARSALSQHGSALSTRPRWRSLNLKLIQGPLEKLNPSLENVDAFVAAEVIEHLDQTTLDQFAPTILGKYRPRILLLTTPNYCFNSNFGPSPSTRPGFADPTGRTDRVFRHDDHKFEWTLEEFTKWCEGVAEDYGYHVTIQGVGEGIYRTQGVKYNEKQRRPRTSDNLNDTTRYASQAACFRRHSASPRGRGMADEASYFGPGSSFVTGPSSVAGMRRTTLDPSRKVSDGAVGDDEEDDESRRARSRRPENLPFLSNPSPTCTFPAPPIVGEPKPISPTTPKLPLLATSHRLVWEQQYDCTGPSDRGKTIPLSSDDIISLVMEKQRQLFVASQWNDDDEDQGKIRNKTFEARVKLWDIWSDDEIRASCGGQMSLLLDSLRLVAPDTEVTDHKVVVVGSDGKDWHLRVLIKSRYDPPAQVTIDDRNGMILDPPAVDSDVYLVYLHTQTVKNWHEKVQEARQWIPRDHHPLPWKRVTNKTTTPPTKWE